MRRMMAVLWVVLMLPGLPGCGMFQAADRPAELSRLAGWKGASPNSNQAFKFVVLSDRTGGHDRGVYESAIEQVNLLKPDFVICVGDLIEGYSDDDAKINPMWDEVEAMVARLDAPFFYCPGNHDVSTDTELAIYTRRHGVAGKTYYSFDYRGSHFVVLDSITAGRRQPYASEMFDWLAKDLAKARSAQHLFLFFHYPHMNDEGKSEVGDKLWARLLPMLPREKTTIFNGHWHNLAAFDDAGVQTYVLADTGANPVEGPRELGNFRQFALVSVEQGRPTIAVLPVGEVRPVAIGFDNEDLYRLTQAAKVSCIPMEGGRASFAQTNVLDCPVSVSLQFASADWDLANRLPSFQLKPGQTEQVNLALKPKSASASQPGLTATYEFLTRRGKVVKAPNQCNIGLYMTLDIPIIKAMTLDGSLEPWKDIPARTIASADRVFRGKELWKGAADASYELRSATDGERIFVAVRVWDDQLCAQKDLKQPGNNDAVEFFWDVRPPEQQDGARGAGTGQIVLMLPDKGNTLVPMVDAKKEPIKSDLKTALRFVEGGYLVQFSVPLKDLGMIRPVKPGEGINLELKLDDRDEQDGKPTLKLMTTAGVVGPYKNTSGYARGTFRE